MQLRIMVSIGVLLGHMVGIEAIIPSRALAAGSGVVISGLQYAGTAKSTDEFVELFNPTSADVAIAGWALQYRAASATNGTDCAKGWITKATVGSASLAAGGHFLFAPTAYLAADASFSAGLAAAGTVRLLDAHKTPQDGLAWGAASCGSGQGAAAPPAGQSLQRRAGPDGAHGDNATDFFIQAHPAPQSSTTTFAPAPDPASPPPPPLPVARAPRSSSANY